MKRIISVHICSIVALTLFASAPSIREGSVSIRQAARTHKVTVEYALDNGPAIVTLDIQTNGVSIGAQNFAFLTGDVNKVVTNGTHTIGWTPYETWPDHVINEQTVSAVVTAWPTNSPPPYMVIDLTLAKTIYYYPCAEAVPFGVTNDMYKTDYLVLRRIPAAGVTYRMGALSTEYAYGREAAHEVSLTNDYYLGVYTVTEYQWYKINGSWRHPEAASGDGRLCPVTNVGMPYQIRGEAADSCDWPANGHAVKANLFLGKLAAHAGMDFDLPTEAQWEYACRAGCGSAYNDGSEPTAKGAGNVMALGNLGWFEANSTNQMSNVAEKHPVGLKTPNAWGLYDMHGNVWECCLDWYVYTLPDAVEPGGAANASAASTANYKIIRGGCYSASADWARSAFRYYVNWGDLFSKSVGNSVGFRVLVPGALRW